MLGLRSNVTAALAVLALWAAQAGGIYYLGRSHMAAAVAARQAAADEAARADTWAREAARLAAQTADDLAMGVLSDEIRRDADADRPAVGVRDAARLNRVR